MNIEQWLDDLIGHDTRRIASEKAGYAQSTISRQLARGKLRPETVISLCRAYDRNPVDGLIETGYLYAHEVDTNVRAALELASNQDILNEILRRSDPEARRLFTADGMPGVVDIPDADVVPIRPMIVQPAEYDSDEIPEDEPYAADSSPIEPEMGDDDYHDGP